MPSVSHANTTTPLARPFFTMVGVLFILFVVDIYIYRSTEMPKEGYQPPQTLMRVTPSEITTVELYRFTAYHSYSRERATDGWNSWGLFVPAKVTMGISSWSSASTTLAIILPTRNTICVPTLKEERVGTQQDCRTEGQPGFGTEDAALLAKARSWLSQQPRIPQ